MTINGIPRLIETRKLTMENVKIVGGGNLGIYVLRLSWLIIVLFNKYGFQLRTDRKIIGMYSVPRRYIDGHKIWF